MAKLDRSTPVRDAARMPAMCVHCDAPMKLKLIVPTMFARAVGNVVFVCLSCGIENPAGRS
jgi:hypothetical protein